MDDSARLIVTVLLAAFVIERAGAVVAFLADTPKGPERNRAIYRFLFAGVLGVIAVWLADIRVLRHLNPKISPWVDHSMSWLVLVAGADRIRDFAAGGGGGEATKKPELPPIQILITDKDGQMTVHELKAN